MNTSNQEPGRRERRRQETAERIMLCAVELFEAQGYTGTTVEQITAAADVAKGTFFNYFETKEHLLGTIVRHLGTEFSRLDGNVVEVRDVRAHIREFVHWFVNRPQRTPLLLRTVFGMAISDPRVGEPFMETVRRARAALTQVLRRGQEIGQVRRDLPPEVLARTFQQFILGTQILWSVDPNGDLHRWLDTMIDVYFDGIAPRPEGEESKS